MTLEEAKKQITPLNTKAMEEAVEHWNSIAKPLHSLGKLEDLVVQLAGIAGTPNVKIEKRALVAMCADNGVVEEGVTQSGQEVTAIVAENVQLAGIAGTPNVKIEKRALVAMCADNGVVEEGVTQSGQEVTAIVAENFLKAETTACIMAKNCGADVYPVDVGMAADTKVRTDLKVTHGTKNMAKLPAMTREEAIKAIEAGIFMAEELKDRGYQILATGEMGIGNTTTNMAKLPAMTREEAIKAIEAGIFMAEELKDRGYQILATGEMGIGNTTTSSAVASVLMEEPVETMTGRGAGLTSEGLARKIKVIKDAIALHKPDREDAIDVLAKVGGFDIAGMAGVFLGGAALKIPVIMDGFISCVAALVAVSICPEVSGYILASHVSGMAGVFLGGAALKIPVIMDGFISCVAALVAVSICPEVSGYILASHVSKEPAARLILEYLQKEAVIHGDMCLGEGTGAIALLPLLDLGIAVYHSMSTFEEIHVEQYEELK